MILEFVSLIKSTNLTKIDSQRNQKLRLQNMNIQYLYSSNPNFLSCWICFVEVNASYLMKGKILLLTKCS